MKVARYQVGASRVDITPKNPVGMHFFGWGLIQHVAERVEEPLHARAIAMIDQESGNRIVLVCLDLGCVSEALRIEVMAEVKKRCGLEEHEVMLSATHTHSAPGGFSDYVLYALSCGGFRDDILQLFVAGTVEAIVAALKNVKPAHLRESRGEFKPSDPVAFNRSISAYNRNPSVVKRHRWERHLAVDRNMVLLRFDGEDGKPIAMWNWFAVHGTCLHSDQVVVHPDNKGLSAAQFEEHMTAEGHPDFIAVFSQGAAGDVSPNFKKYFMKRNKRGCSPDDVESCRIHSEFQTRHALELYRAARDSEVLTGPIDSVIEYRDLSAVVIDQCEWGSGLRTGPAEVGLPQIRGTAEGLGASAILIAIISYYLRFAEWVRCKFSPAAAEASCRRHEVQFNKITLITSQEREVLGVKDLSRFPIPGWLDPTVTLLKKWHRSPHVHERPFSPQILPVQFVRIGPIGLAAVPAEFTTVSGKHLAAAVMAEVAAAGIKQVVVQTYANAYASYVATPEEYELQRYEGGCTQFGRWTLPAYMHLFRQMTSRWMRGERAEVKAPKRPSRSYLEMLRP